MSNYLDGYGKETCGHCGLRRTVEGHDGCIGTLSNVMNACFVKKAEAVFLINVEKAIEKGVTLICSDPSDDYVRQMKKEGNQVLESWTDFYERENGRQITCARRFLPDCLIWKCVRLICLLACFFEPRTKYGDSIIYFVLIL